MPDCQEAIESLDLNSKRFLPEASLGSGRLRYTKFWMHTSSPRLLRARCAIPPLAFHIGMLKGNLTKANDIMKLTLVCDSRY